MRKIKLKSKRPRFRITRYILGGLAVVVLSTLGINATDNFGNLSNSIIGKYFNSYQPRCPEDMVYVTFNKGNFCIDKYENSLSDQCQFINPTDTSQSQTNIGDKACQSLSVGGGTPWINITQEQAMLACTKAGKRLPTNAEWQAAALGTPDKSTDWNQDDCQVDKNWSAQPGATGSGKNCLSFVGAYDMIGNVWEWVDGTIDNNTFAGRQLPPEGYIQSMNMNDDLPAETASTSNSTLYNDYFWVKDSKTRGLIRGGYWANKADAGQYSAYAVFLPSDYGTTIGFRCVK